MSATLTAVGACAREAWRRALALDSSALVSQTPTWMDCICAVGCYEDATRAYTAADGHELILPLARRPLPGGIASSLPFGWSSGGLLSSRGYLTEEDVAGVVADLMRQRALAIAIKPSPASHPLWARAVPSEITRMHYVTHTVDLTDGFGAVWKRLSKNVRRRCRQAERTGVTIELDTSGRLLPVFYALHRMSVARWANQHHEPPWLARWRASRRDPWEKFETVTERLGSACRIWVAWRCGKPLAADIVLAHGQHSIAWRAAMNREAVSGTGAPQLLVCRALEDACAAGHRSFHLGDSAPGSRLARTKVDYGGEAISYSGYRFERLPLTAADRFLRRQVKRVIGFRD